MITAPEAGVPVVLAGILNPDVLSISDDSVKIAYRGTRGCLEPLWIRVNNRNGHKMLGHPRRG